MTDKKVWFITGASRGMGVEFAKAALAVGHAPAALWPHPIDLIRRRPDGLRLQFRLLRRQVWARGLDGVAGNRS